MQESVEHFQNVELNERLLKTSRKMLVHDFVVLKANLNLIKGTNCEN